MLEHVERLRLSRDCGVGWPSVLVLDDLDSPQAHHHYEQCEILVSVSERCGPENVSDGYRQRVVEPHRTQSIS